MCAQVDLKEMAADDVLLTVMKDTQHGQSREWAIQEGGTLHVALR